MSSNSSIIIICGTFDGSQIWPPGMVEAFKWNSSYQILQDFGQHFELKHRKKWTPWITMATSFPKKTEGNGSRFGVARTSNFEGKHLESEKDGTFYDVLTSSLFVHESKSKMCESTKPAKRKVFIPIHAQENMF